MKEEEEERGEEVGLEEEGEESRDNEFEDEDFGRCMFMVCFIQCTRWGDNPYQF